MFPFIDKSLMSSCWYSFCRGASEGAPSCPGQHSAGSGSQQGCLREACQPCCCSFEKGTACSAGSIAARGCKGRLRAGPCRVTGQRPAPVILVWGCLQCRRHLAGLAFRRQTPAFACMAPAEGTPKIEASICSMTAMSLAHGCHTAQRHAVAGHPSRPSCT